MADVQALVDREYCLPSSLADSLTILIDGERLDLTSPDHFQRPIRFSATEALAMQLRLRMVAGEGDVQVSVVTGLLSAAASGSSVSCAETLDDPELPLNDIETGNIKIKP